MLRTHTYNVGVTWTGNRGRGTESYSAFSRDHTIGAQGKPPLLGSADPAFRGNAGRYNPEELLLAAISSCHMLWYLHLCVDAAIVVVAYADNAVGLMEEAEDGGGRFTKVVLRPEVTVEAGADLAMAAGLHTAAHGKCFIANSVNFPILHDATTRVEPVVTL